MCGKNGVRSHFRPKASVLMITYNHQEFIAQAIESALMQITDFDYEIVIGEDCSTDRTREIVREYAEKYPDKIRASFHPHNLGPHRFGLGGKNNLVATYKACRGQYLAFLDGDDYWTDRTKLQRQVEFMDNHPECTFCCHPVRISYSDGRNQHWRSVVGISPKEVMSIEDLLTCTETIELPTPSMMIRAGILGEFPSWFAEVQRGDTALHFLLADKGKVGFMRECMAVHRKHGQGASRLFDTDPEYCDENFLNLYLYLDRHFENKYHSFLAKRISDLWMDVAFARKRRKKYGAGAVALFKHLSFGFRNRQDFFATSKNTIRLLLPDRVRKALRRIRLNLAAMPLKDQTHSKHLR